MRPRVFPAEDRHRAAGEKPPLTGFNEAAGIPRGRRPDGDPYGGVFRASMRPRVFPAEDVAGRPGPVSDLRRFNEAAGIPRGRREDVRLRTLVCRASMRPRVFPAEDLRLRLRVDLPHPASMRPRVFPAEDGGKHGIRGRHAVRFNEAAGIPRGRHCRYRTFRLLLSRLQ